MKLLIINQPLNNRGDESAHKALVRSLINQIKDINIKVLFVNGKQNSIEQFAIRDSHITYVNLAPARAYSKFSIPVLKKHLYFLWYLHPTTRKIIKLMKEADWVVCAPGGICMGGFQNWEHIFLLEIAKMLHKKIAYYGRSFGPFPTETKSNRLFKEISINLLKYFSFTSIRDEKSEKLADSLNLKYTPTVDSAFLDSPKVELPTDIKCHLSTKKYIVFVPNLLIWHYKYKGFVTKENVLSFYSSLLECIFNKYPTFNIIMLPQTFNYGNYEGDDIHFFKELKTLIHDERIIVIADCYSSDIQETIISNAEFVVGARYHSIVFAINNNVPFVALSYEHKIEGLLETLNKKDRMIDITKAFENKENTKKTIQLFNEKITTLQKDKEVQIKAKKIANDCLKQFINIIQKKNG